MPKLPDDLIDPAPPPSATPSGKAAPSDLIDPSGGGGGGGGDDSSAGEAATYGMVSAIPWGKTLGAGVETAESYLPAWMRAPGDAPVDQTGEGWAQRYAENRARIGATDTNLRAAHPYIYTGASIAPMLAAPEVGGLDLATAKGAAAYGAAQGASEATDDPDWSAGSLVGKTALGAATGAGGTWAMNKILPVAGDVGRRDLLAAADRLSQQTGEGGPAVTMPSFAATTSSLWKKMGVWAPALPSCSTQSKKPRINR